MRNILIVLLLSVGALGLEACNGCPTGQSRCGDVCLDTLADARNCGACGNVCSSDRTCSGGRCVATSCPVGSLLCNGDCINPQSDPRFCGAQGDCLGQNAGSVCPSGQVCALGACAAGCPLGLLNCNSACIDPQNDRDYCGAQGDCAGSNAGTACGSAQICRQGKCQNDCTGGTLACGGSCVDPQVDPGYCGASGDCLGTNAGSVCSSTEVCALGRCALACPQGYLACNGRCVDSQIDRNFCGATGDCLNQNAGAACGDGQVCQGGRCVLSCQGELVDCGGRCIDPQTNRGFCGASGDCARTNAGTACRAGEVCVQGRCALGCPAGLLDCSGQCIDPLTNSSFCGASGSCQGAEVGELCQAGSICDGGRCVPNCQPTELVCGGRCIDPKVSPFYCGAVADCVGENAGQTCAEDYYCASGSCQQICPPGNVACFGSCIDPLTSPVFCGASGDCQGNNAGSTCGRNFICSGGRCLVDNPLLSALSVSGAFLDPQFDPNHTTYALYFVDTCESTGVAVTATTMTSTATLRVNGAPASSGVANVLDFGAGLTPVTIEVTSPTGRQEIYRLAVAVDQSCDLTCCDLSCVDTRFDNDNCGGCGVTCSETQCCSGSCVDLASDENNCGNCGIVCGAGDSCCSGTCADTNQDPNNCGGCGIRCSAGSSCCNGSCVNPSDSSALALFTPDPQALAIFEFNGAATDSSGNTHDPIALGEPLFTSARFGCGLALQGDPQGIDWSAYAATLQTPFTVEVVYTSSNSGGGFGKIFSFNDASDFGWYQINGRFQSYSSGAPLGSLAPNTVHYVALVSTTGTTMDVFIDGVLVGNTPLGFSSPPQQAIFFRDDAATGRGEQITGVVDAMRLSNVARSNIEIMTLWSRINP